MSEFRSMFGAGRVCIPAASRRLTVAAAIVAAAVACLSATSAAPLPDFTVDLSPVSDHGKKSALLVGDKLSGNYNEVFTATANTFAVEGYWDAGQLVHDDGTIPYSAGVSKLGVDYAIYAIFSYQGTYITNATGGVDFVANGGSITLYLDPNVMTGKTLPDTAPNAIVLTKSADDIVLGSGTLIVGEGHFFPTGILARGDFALLFNALTLTPAGSQYFVAPAPFYANVRLDGHFNSLQNATSQQINGSADVAMAQ
jgi:hypothetical protein